MRTITEITEVYKFDELPEEVKTKALALYRNINVEHDWYDYTIEEFKTKLDSLGFINSKVYFTGFWSQGDGACFDAEIDYSVVLPARLKDIECEINIAKTNFANHYCHEKTRYIEYSLYIDENKYPNITKAFNKVMADLEAKRLELCSELYSQLNTEYNFLVSDEQIEETLIANDYEFTIDGEIYC